MMGVDVQQVFLQLVWFIKGLLTTFAAILGARRKEMLGQVVLQLLFCTEYLRKQQEYISFKVCYSLTLL